ncbi:MAG: flavin reductase family protein [Gammaproteobacteria bacterium]|nr:MAG: flavin reductase family protein [Gammaproteobacteria bacterium]
MSKSIKQDNKIRELRDTLGQFTTGVAIVTAPGEDARPIGMTINSFGSISLSPALVSWCIDLRAASHEAFVKARHFSITVLAAHQAELAMRFATRGADKFRDVETDGEAAPVIAGGCAWFKCNLVRTIQLGDHTMLVGEVSEFAQARVAPLIFSGGSFCQLPADCVDTDHHAARAA